MSNEAATATTAAEAAPAPEQVPHGLGASLPAADARAKTEGTFPYAADLWAEGLLWAAVLRSPHAHARIVSIDTAAAKALPVRPATMMAVMRGPSSRVIAMLTRSAT